MDMHSLLPAKVPASPLCLTQSRPQGCCASVTERPMWLESPDSLPAIPQGTHLEKRTKAGSSLRKGEEAPGATQTLRSRGTMGLGADSGLARFQPLIDVGPTKAAKMPLCS